MNISDDALVGILATFGTVITGTQLRIVVRAARLESLLRTHISDAHIHTVPTTEDGLAARRTGRTSRGQCPH